jgi:hypothetical protein
MEDGRLARAICKRLEHKLSRHLDHPRPAASQPGIGLRLVGGLRDQSRRTKPRNHKEIRQSEIRMIEDVEKLRPELQIHPLEKLRIFAHREIHIPETWAIDFIPAQVAEGPRRRIHESIGI